MSDTGENKKAVIGELLNNANTAARRVLSAYNPDLKYHANLKNMKACKSAPIEECAKLLGLVPRDEAGKKLYQNLDILSDRIILKIEALFDIQCDDCTDTYRNKLEDKPLFRCQLCLQGSHNCEALQNKFEVLKPILEQCPKGIVWLCHECLKKNCLDQLRSTERQTETGNELGVEEEEHEEEEEEDAEDEIAEEAEGEERESPRRGREGPENPTQQTTTNSHRTNTGNENICEDYKRRKCRHGRTGDLLINGERCKKNHPPRCRRFCNYGQHTRQGCKRGKDCRYWHPRLCRDSLKNLLCTKEDCTFFHLKGTMRKSVPSLNNRNRPGVDREEDPFPPLQRERRPSLRRDSTSIQENPPTQRPPPRLRFNSLTSNYTPYPPTVGTRPPPPPRTLNAEKNASESFLLRMIENLKEGILSQMENQMTELRASIPKLVREMIPSNQLPQQPAIHLQPYNPHPQQAIPHMMPQMLPNQVFQAYSY